MGTDARTHGDVPDPGVGVALGVLIVHESISWNEPVGGLVLILGTLLAQDRIRLRRQKVNTFKERASESPFISSGGEFYVAAFSPATRRLGMSETTSTNGSVSPVTRARTSAPSIRRNTSFAAR